MRNTGPFMPRNANFAGILIVFCALLTAGTVYADYTVQPLSETTGQQTTLTVPDNGTVQLSLIRSGANGGDGETVDIYASAFGDQQGNVIEVSLELAGRPRSFRLAGVKVDPPVLPLTLHVPLLPAAGRFAGQLFLFRNQTLLKSYSIALTRATAAQFQVRPLPEDGAPQTAITVPPDGRLPLMLTRGEGGQDPVDIELSPFTDERGNVADVQIEIPDVPNHARAVRQNGIQANPILRMWLFVPDFRTPGNYRGQLFLTRQHNVIKSYSFALTRAKTVSDAKLMLDQQAIPLNYTLPAFGSSSPEFTMHLREQSGEWPLEGLFARLEENQATAGGVFDPKRSMTFVVNGTEVHDFWSSSEKMQEAFRRAAPRQQVAVRVALKDLIPGSYTTKIRFAALNSQPDEHQLLTLNLKVRRSWFWAALTLAAAAVISFISTKILRQRGERLQLLRRIDEACPEWLRNEPSFLAIVWTRAFLRQTQDLCRKYLLAGSEIINARIAQIEQVVKKGCPLERISALRGRIGDLQVDAMVIRRAQKRLSRICQQLGTPPLDEKLAAKINADLDALEAWFVPDRPTLKTPSLYWDDLQPDIERLRNEVRSHIDVLTDADVRTAVENLLHVLDSTPNKDDLNQTVPLENAYAALLLLWERRDRPEDLRALAELHKKTPPIDDLFQAADQQAWNRLQSRKIYLDAPNQASPERFEAFQPLLFEAVPIDHTLHNNYLFQHGLEYRWTIEIQKKKFRWPWRRSSEALNTEDGWENATKEPLTPVTNEPRVIQYAPRPGRVKASVKVYFRGAAITGEEPPHVEATKPVYLEIENSSIFRWQRAFTTVELLSTALTLILAIGTGLSTYYFDNLTFGSPKDYLTLFLWGAGADQAKNFVQLVGGAGAAGGTQQPKT